MSKLGDSHLTVRTFIPKLLPGLIKVETTIGDPEARGIIGKAIATLRQVGQVSDESDGSDLPPLALADEKHLAGSLVAFYKKLGATVSPGNVDVMYASSLAKYLVIAKKFDIPEWDKLAPYLAFIASTPEPITIAHEWVVRSATEGTDDGEVPNDELEGEDHATANSL